MTPALLVPGTLCDAAVFGPMLARLELDAVCAPPSAQPDVGAAADAALGLMEGRFVAIGFSLGGFVVLELLRRAPERLAGAVLIASNPLPAQPGTAAPRRADVALARERGTTAVIDKLWPSYVAPANLDRADIAGVVRDMAARVGAELFAAQTELAIHRPDSRATIRDTQVPLLALCGAEDVMGPAGGCAALGDGPTARVETIAGAGHFVPLEAPEAAATAVNRWLEEAAACCSA